MNTLQLAILTLCLLIPLTNTQDVFTVPDVFPCNGEKIEMTCYIEPPTSEDFWPLIPDISINNSQPYDYDKINKNQIPGIDTSRYQIDFVDDWPKSPRIAASITITSYEPQDSATIFGCHGQYFNETYTVALASGSAPQPAQVPDQIYSVQATIESINSLFYCVASVDISFNPPSSEREINYYKVYVDGEFECNISSQTSYFSPSQIDISISPATTYKISVAAVSCAGTAELSANDGTISIPSYDLDSLSFSLGYFNSLYITWTFKGDSSIPIYIGYNLKVNTAFKNDGESNILNQTLDFNYLSTKTSYTFDLGLSIISEKAINLDVTIKLGITDQCFDTAYSGNTLTYTQSGLESNVPPIVLPYNWAWIIVIIVTVALAVCSCSNIVAIMFSLNECSKNRSRERRNAYINLVPETRVPLINRNENTQQPSPAPGYSVNTAVAPVHTYHDEA